MADKKQWIDLAAHGIFLGDQRMADGVFRLVLVDLNEIADVEKLAEINFHPVQTSARYSKGVFFLKSENQQLRPTALARALGLPSCPLVEMEPSEIDKTFREKLRERFNITIDAITQQSVELGINADGHRVFDTSLGRLIRLTPENAIVEGSSQASKLSPGIFLRATNNEELAKCTDGFVLGVMNGEKYKRADAIRFRDTIFDGRTEEADIFRFQEALEASVNRIYSANSDLSEDGFRFAKDIYYNLPTAEIRTSESIHLQQYSTPLPMALIAQKILVGNDDPSGKTLLEPTAGNGGLISLLPSDKISIHALEYDRKRLDNLKLIPNVISQFGDATAVNFSNYFSVDDGFDYTISNPPFGGMEIKRDLDILKNITRLDHFIPLRSLESRKEQGRSVFIFGVDDQFSNGEIRFQSSKFLNYLYDYYEVHGCTEIDGRLYSRQGAASNVRMIVVGNKRPEPITADVPEKLDVIRTYEDLWNWSDSVIDAYTKSASRENKIQAISNDDLLISSSFASSGALFDPDGISVIDFATEQSAGGSDDLREKNLLKLKTEVAEDNNDVSAKIAERVDAIGKLLEEAEYQRGENGAFDGKNIKISIEVVGETEEAEQHINYVVTDKRNGMVIDVKDDLMGTLNLVKDQLRNSVKSLYEINFNQNQVAEPSGVAEAAPRNDNEFQVPYQAASKVGEASTMIPINMAGATYAALAALEREVGSVDDYVASKLDYEPVELSKYFSPEQVDALALSINAAENNRGIINADQTGIGKGRWVAGMMRYARIQGLTPVFLTIKPELFTDIFRDIGDIGSMDKFKKVFIFNNGEDIKKYGSEKDILFKATSIQERNKAIQDGCIDDDIDMVLATYSQFQRAIEKNPKTGLLTEIAADKAMLVLDESHVAAGASNISSAISGAVSVASSVMYGSATPLKGVNNFAIYNKIFPQSVDLVGLPDTLKTGGEALQEAISANMAKDGVIIRREHDFSQLTFHTREPAPDQAVKNRDIADKLAMITARLSHLSGDVNEVVYTLNQDFKKKFEAIPDHERQGNRMQASSLNFGSRLHSINRQFLLGIKIEEAISAAVIALENGRKPVIAVENTGESLLRQVVARRTGAEPLQIELDALDERGIVSDKDKQRRAELVDKINTLVRDVVLEEPPQFRELLDIMLDRVSVIKVQGRYGEVAVVHPSSDGFKDRASEIRDMIREFPDLPLTPIDLIQIELQRRGYACAEVSGRGISLRPLSVADEQKNKFGIKYHPKADAVSNVAGFQNGKYDAITITRSGSTGISLHASNRFADSDIRQREFIVLQKAQNIAEFLQWLGRVNRKDQVSVPLITTLDSGLPAEVRLTMMHNTKLRKLSANTTSNRDNVNAEGDLDLLNSVGDEVALEWLYDNTDLAKALDIDLPSDNDDVNTRFNTENPFINKLLGRLMMVSVAEQEKILSEISRRFTDKVEELDQQGINPFKVSVYDWRAKLVSSEELQTGVIRSTNSTFDEPVRLASVSFEEDVFPIRSGEIKLLIQRGIERYEATQTISLQERVKALRLEQDSYVRNQLPEKIRKENADYSLSAIFKSHELPAASRAKERTDWLISQLDKFKPGHPIQYEDPFSGSVNGFITEVNFPDDEEGKFLLSRYDLKAVFVGETKPRSLTLATVLAQGNEIGVYPVIEPGRFDNAFVERSANKALAPFDEVPDGKLERKRLLLDGNLFRACEIAAAERLGAPILYTDSNGDRQRAVLLRDSISPEAVKSMPIPMDARDVCAYIKAYFSPTRDWTHHANETLRGTAPPLRIFTASVKEQKEGEGIEIYASSAGSFKLMVPGTKSRSGALIADGALFNIGEETPANSLRLELVGDRKVMTAKIPDDLVEPLLLRMQKNRHVGKFFILNPEIPIIEELKQDWQAKFVQKEQENEFD